MTLTTEELSPDTSVGVSEYSFSLSTATMLVSISLVILTTQLRAWVTWKERGRGEEGGRKEKRERSTFKTKQLSQAFGQLAPMNSPTHTCTCRTVIEHACSYFYPPVLSFPPLSASPFPLTSLPVSLHLPSLPSLLPTIPAVHS